MRLRELHEMAKALSVKTCGKCNQPITDRNYYYYKGQYNHKGGCPPAGTTPPHSGQQTVSAPAQTQTDTASAPAPTQKTKPMAARRQPPTPAQNATAAITAWLHRHGVEDFTISESGVVDVNGSVDMDIDDIKKLPVKFGRVTGDFIVAGSELETLEGCPQVVGRSFDCTHTLIKSFVGGPQQVGRSYIAVNCDNLESLEGLPRVVPGRLDLSGKTKLQTLEGISEEIGQLWLPESISCHNIHKMVKKVRTAVIIEAGVNTMTHMLGILLIEGLRDGVRVTKDPKLEDFLNAALDRRPTMRDDPTAAGEKLPFRDILDVQEKLIDAGYTKWAKL